MEDFPPEHREKVERATERWLSIKSRIVQELTLEEPRCGVPTVSHTKRCESLSARFALGIYHELAVRACAQLTSEWTREIRGDGLAVPIEIVDERTVSNFSVWNGPGVGTYTKGVMDPPAYLNPDKPQGRFVDWPRGIATRRPERLHRFEVTFYLGQGPNQRKYMCSQSIMP